MKHYLLLLLSLSGQLNLVNPQQKVYTNFNWVDPINKTVHTNTMLIENNGKILYIGPKKSIGKNSHIVDLTNKYVISSFIDTHTHVTLGAVNVQKKDGKIEIVANSSDDIARHNGKLLLAYGITDVRNPGGNTSDSIRYKNQVKKGDWVGPDAYVSGELLDATPFEGLSTAVNNKEQIQKVISHQKSLGVDFIKLYSGLSIDLLEQAIQIAHTMGLKTVAHLDKTPWDKAVKLGLNGIVHAMPISLDLIEKDHPYLNNQRPGPFSFFEWYEAINFESLRYKQFISNLSKSDVTIDLTLIAFKNAFWGDRDSVINHPQLYLVYPDLLNNWKSFFTFTIGWQVDDFNRSKEIWPKVQTFVRHLYESGVHLTIGTDMGNPWVIPGLSFHQEMKLLVDAGLPIFEVLKMATINGAQSIQQIEFKGSLAAGKKANFLILNRDPSQNIENTQSIQTVIKNGHAYTPQDLINSLNLMSYRALK